jgi:hypothetical protein
LTKGEEILYSNGRMKRIKFDTSFKRFCKGSQNLKIKRLIFFLFLSFIFVSQVFTKDIFLKLSFPSSTPEKPQKPKIDFQTIVESTGLPIELRNFRIKEEAEKEKKLVLKALPRHILEDRNYVLYPFSSKGIEGFNLRLDFFPAISAKSWENFGGRIFTLSYYTEDARFSLFSGFANSPIPSSVIGGRLEKEFGFNSFDLGVFHKKTFLTNNPSILYNVSFLTDFEILRDLNLSLEFDYIYFYNSESIFNSISPKMEIVLHPSKFWILKGEFSYVSNSPLLEMKENPFLPFSSYTIMEPFSSSYLSLSILRIVFSDFNVGFKFSYRDIGDNSFGFPSSEEEREPLKGSNGAFESLFILSRENGSGIRFVINSGILVPSNYPENYCFFLSKQKPESPFVFTFSSHLKGEFESLGTSFEIGYNWTSTPYIFLSLKDIYSSKILLSQKLPFSKIIGRNIAIFVELQNFLNFLKPPVKNHYLLIFYPQWIKGGFEIDF